MALASTDWKDYKSTTVDETSSNGGPQSWTQIVSGLAENLFPALTEAEQTAGGTWYRKLFRRAQSSTDAPGYSTYTFVKAPTDADDILVFFVADDDWTQGDVTGSERVYGAGSLESDVSSGTTIVVTVEDWSSYEIFADTDKIVLWDGTKERIYTVSGAPSPSGDDITLTLSTAISESWSASNTYVASMYSGGTVEPTIDNVVETTSAGTWDESAIVPHSVGSYEGTVTLTFTSATAFDADIDGTSIGSGNVSSDFEPVNSDTSTKYFTIPSSSWGGTWASAETVEFDLHPPVLIFALLRYVPAGVSPEAGNTATLRTLFQTST